MRPFDIDTGNPRATSRRRRLGTVALAAALMLGGCASRSTEVRPVRADPAHFAAWPCERLHDEIDLVQERAIDVAYAVDARSGNNMIALGLGVTVFWPALLAVRPEGLEARELAALKGRDEALRAVVERKGCGARPSTMAAVRAGHVPVALGERLVYEDRPGGAPRPRELGLRVTELRHNQIEFAVDIGGTRLPELWRQDLAGNPLPGAQSRLIGWQRLLRRQMELGDVLNGDLTLPDPNLGSARVRGQVVAVGPQEIAGRRFDVAVIELFGEAPQPPSVSAGTTRLDGVMAVDRRSGVLLRLELRCTNPEFALRRRLMRIEPA
ncbi:MAG: hypothetical protein ACKVQR_00340 [Aquabacterium sp.]